MPSDAAILEEATRTLFLRTTNAAFVMRLDGTMMEVNDATCLKMGASRSRILSEGLPLDISNTARVAAKFALAVRGIRSRYPVSGRRADGSWFHADVLNIPVVLNGGVCAVVAIARDIDDFEQDLLSKRAVDQRFASVLNGISDALFFIDRDSCFTYLNPRAEALVGRAAEDLLGQSVWDVGLFSRESAFGEACGRALSENRKVTVRDRVGSWGLVIEATIHPSLEGLALSLQDVSEQEAEALRAQARDRKIASQAALLDISRDPIIVRNVDHTIEYWNRAAAELYGWSADEAVGRSIRELIYADHERFDAADAALLAAGHWNGDIEQVSRDGRRIIADCRWTLVFNANGSPDAVLAVNTDVTERRRQQEADDRALRMQSLGTLAGGIAHDLNNVLTPLLMTVQLLAADETDDGRLASFRVLEESVRRGADMVRQVLTFGRGDGGRRIPVDLLRLLRDAESFCHQTMPSNIVVTVAVADPGEESWFTTGDPTQLSQVLGNLIVNARDAMPSGGAITLTARHHRPTAIRTSPPDTPMIIIGVQDSGPGVPEHIAARVFEPFFTTKEVGDGSGLGLATASSIIRNHHGQLTVANNEIGAVFEIHLPMSHSGSAAREAKPLPPRRGQGELVLVVDDDETIGAALEETLASIGYTSISTSSGAAALKLLDRHPAVRVVLTDFTMPGMTGADLLAAIAILDPTLPVITMSGFTGSHIASTLELAKPFTTEQLQRAIAHALDPTVADAD